MMTSNALSTGAVGTSAPVICKAVPFPPAIPPPPLTQTKFWCFSTINEEHPVWGTSFGATCFATWKEDLGYYEGVSTYDVYTPRTGIILYIYGDPTKWGAEVWYDWPGSPGRAWEFSELLMPEPRPYISGLAEKEVENPPGTIVIRYTCVVREVPS